MTLPGLISRAAFVKGDPYVAGNDSNTKLLLHCDGANGATTMVDSSLSPKTGFSFTGEAQISTAIKKFGKSSLRMGTAQAQSGVCS